MILLLFFLRQNISAQPKIRIHQTENQISVSWDDNEVGYLLLTDTVLDAAACFSRHGNYACYEQQLLGNSGIHVFSKNEPYRFFKLIRPDNLFPQDGVSLTKAELIRRKNKPYISEMKIIWDFTEEIYTDSAIISIVSDAINPHAGQHRNVRNTVSEYVLHDSRKKLELITGLISNASRIIINGAKDNRGVILPPLKARVEGGLDVFEFTFAYRKLNGFSAGNSNITLSSTKSNLHNDSQPNISYDEELKVILENRKKQGLLTDAIIENLLELGNSGRSKTAIPDPLLRNAMLSLKGTRYDAIIDQWLIPPLGSRPKVIWGNDFEDASQMKTIAGTQILRINEKMKPEHIGTISTIFIKESLQNPDSNSIWEKIIASWFQILGYAEQVFTEPEIIKRNTLYSKLYNEHLIMMCNSGRNGYPRIGLNQAPLSGVVNALGIEESKLRTNSHLFHGFKMEDIKTYSSLLDYLKHKHSNYADIVSPGNDYLQELIKNTTDTSANIYLNSMETIEIIDNQNAIDSKEAFRLAKFLGLTMSR